MQDSLHTALCGSLKCLFCNRRADAPSFCKGLGVQRFARFDQHRTQSPVEGIRGISWRQLSRTHIAIVFQGFGKVAVGEVAVKDVVVIQTVIQSAVG